MSRAWLIWENFWFGCHKPLGLALMRIQLGLVLLVLYGHRHLHNLKDFTDSGLIPRSLAMASLPDIQRPPFVWFFWPDSMAAGIHGLFLGLLLLVTLGIGTRWIAWLAWIIHLGFLQRNYSILFGADVISCLLLFYLAFTKCDERLSVASLWRTGGEAPVRPPDALSSTFTRLLQFQMGVIYGFTGMEKLRGMSWWDGTALWTVFANPQMVLYDLDFMRSFPLVIAAMTFGIVMFEIYWPAAMTQSKIRPWWLAAGLAMHVGIGVLMGLWSFSLIMLATYWLFLREDSLRRGLDQIRQWWRGRRTVVQNAGV